MEAYAPSSLPAVTGVEGIPLAGDRRTDRIAEALRAAGGGRVEGPAAERIAGLWRGLPPGRQARCHLPAYGHRYLVGREVVSQASVCWQSDNVYGEAAGRPVHYEFDAGGAALQGLLAELRRVVPLSGEAAAEPNGARDTGREVGSAVVTSRNGPCPRPGRSAAEGFAWATNRGVRKRPRGGTTPPE
jgi:hypothetical protein